MTLDPWRYRCPDCGSTQVAKLITFDHHKPAIEPESRYHCRNCGTRTNERKDMKTGELVQ